MAQEQAPRKSGWLNLLIDFGPVLIYFIAYRLLRPDDASQTLGEIMAVTKSTLAFVVATVVALVVSKWRLGRISPMLWLTTILVVGFGLLTVWSQDEFWIRHKPTAVYILFAAMLFGGLLRGKAVLRYLLESAFEGLSDEGWRKLSRNWAFFFLFLAGVNEAFANPAWFTFEQWLKAKLFVFLPLSFLFTFAQIPMLLRHGLSAGDKDEVVNNPPHE
ncbi:MAG: septation protein IspZ [Novosphingobium sp.]|nr:septation protein IspZ [Novosphingobium sp.]